MPRSDIPLGRRELGGGHFVEVKPLVCGMKAYAAMNVTHDWDEPPLNRCACGKPITRWTAALGHVCSCGATCDRRCIGG